MAAACPFPLNCLIIFSVSSNAESQVSSLLRCVRLITKLFNLTSHSQMDTSSLAMNGINTPPSPVVVSIFKVSYKCLVYSGV